MEPTTTLEVTSKAHMLEEIINYVQALQHQVEFLSMKLASTGAVSCDFSEQNISSIVKPEAQQSFPQAHIATSANNCPLIDSSVTYLYQQQERPIDFYQEDNLNLLWSTIDEQRQRFCNHKHTCLHFTSMSPQPQAYMW